jgi:lysyl endopeptidase
MSVGFTQFQLPDAATLYVYGSEKSIVHGPYTRIDKTRGKLWTPLVRGQELVIELKVPKTQRSEVRLVAGKVVHGYRSLLPSPSRHSKSANCHLDVACDEADGWENQARAVARYSFTRDSSRFVCSGSLINNTARNGRPLFLTASHCVHTPKEAASMVFYWNFQTSQCRTPGTEESGTFPLDLERWIQTSSGAKMRARYGIPRYVFNSDLSLVEVDDIIPDEFNLYLAGWNREFTTTQQSTTIHHPRGHAKRISFDDDPTTKTGYRERQEGDSHLRVENWERGGMEPGSSGAPLFNQEKQIVGVFSGSKEEEYGCDRDRGPDKPAWFGRLSEGFFWTRVDGGHRYKGRSFGDVLDPKNTEAKTLSGQAMTSPPSVSNFRVDKVTSTSATLRWTAPDHPSSSPPVEYELRVQPKAPITTIADFRDAQQIEDPPAPASPGSEQSIDVALEQDTSYYFAIRTLDDEKHASPLTSSEDATIVSSLRIAEKPAPNPARQNSKFSFVVEERKRVRIELYDILGRRVRVLFDDSARPFRQHTVTVDASSLSSGMYVARIRSDNDTRTVKIVVRR